MLLEFKFKNAGSFKNETILDLGATQSNEYNNTIIQYGGERFLPVISIYGPNASGKSNVYGAFSNMLEYIYNSLNSDQAESLFLSLREWTFRLDDASKNDDIEFDIYFTLQNDPKEYIYNYGYKIGTNRVKEEWLLQKNKSNDEYKIIFTRGNNDKIIFNNIDQKFIQNLKLSLNDKTLLLTLGKSLKIEICEKVYEWFKNNIAIDFSRINIEDEMKNSWIGFLEDNDERKKLIKFLSSFDNSIKEMHVDKVKFGNTTIAKYDITTIHRVKDKDYPIHMECESLGTKKMIYLYKRIVDVLQVGGVLFVDELNASLHSLLIRNLILMFKDKTINANHAQLVFTSHDVWQLSGKSLRRDEIWFIDKDNNGVSSLYSLGDFKDKGGTKIRKEADFETNYMKGKYGAIPDVKTMFLDKEVYA